MEAARALRENNNNLTVAGWRRGKDLGIQKLGGWKIRLTIFHSRLQWSHGTKQRICSIFCFCD